MLSVAAVTKHKTNHTAYSVHFQSPWAAALSTAPPAHHIFADCVAEVIPGYCMFC